MEMVCHWLLLFFYQNNNKSQWHTIFIELKFRTHCFFLVFRSALVLQIRLSLTVALITLLFVMAWLPLFALTMLATFDPGGLPSSITFARLLHFVKWMHYSSSALNPFLYSYRNPDLRRTIGVLLRRLILRSGPGVDEVFKRRSSSMSTTRLRKLSNTSERSRKTSTESQKGTSRARSGTVLSWLRIRRENSPPSGKNVNVNSYLETKENNNVKWETLRL